MIRKPHKKCPPGYKMKNGVCSDTIKLTKPFTGNSGNTREDCDAMCQSIMNQASQCFGLHNYPQSGCSCHFVCGLNPQWALYQACYACNPPSGMMSDYHNCMYNCNRQGGGIGGESGHHGSPISPPKGFGSLRRGGRVKPRRRRR